ncbi:MAG TPA: hypothetical protein VF092_03275 [Longimicrobium sp.]
MYSLLTLPRGAPDGPDLPARAGAADLPAGIVIRPGPVPARVPLRDLFAGARAAAAA